MERQDGPWTLDRVERELPELAPLARLHGAIESALADEERRAGHVHPSFEGAPGVHWMEGRPLLDAVRGDALSNRLTDLLRAAATAVAAAAPETAGALGEALGSPEFARFAWPESLLRFREAGWEPGTPHATLFRFLVLRAVSVPARHLARSYSAPHPDRWTHASCPFCGVGAAASVARTGSGRTFLCVLCGGRWESTETACAGCGERDLSKFRVLASRDAGPATIEACGVCGSAVKVFASSDLVWGPPLAIEVATVRLDLLVERDGDAYRDPVALAALFPPG
jgi:transcription elongation factor Elf1